MLGSNGLIINKSTGACFVLGSGFTVERDLAAYVEGYQFESYDLSITAIQDLEATLDALVGIGPSIVEPEFAHGIVWRIPRSLTRDEIRLRLSSLPFTFTDIKLYFRYEVLCQVRREGSFAFDVREHRG